MTDDLTSDSRDAVRTSIVTAAAALLREGGARAVTTRAVADAAGVQAPTIYRLFGDKDGLIEAVAERVMADHVATKSVSPDDADPLVAFRASWLRHIDFSLENPDLYAILNAPGRAQSSPATALGADVLRQRIRNLARAGLLRVSEQRALDMFRSAATGAAMILLGTPEESRDASLAQAMFDAVAESTIVDVEPAARGDDLAAIVGFATLVPELSGLSDTERALLGEWVERAISTASDR